MNFSVTKHPLAIRVRFAKPLSVKVYIPVFACVAEAALRHRGQSLSAATVVCANKLVSPENGKDCKNERQEDTDIEQTGQRRQQRLNEGLHAWERIDRTQGTKDTECSQRLHR